MRYRNQKLVRGQIQRSKKWLDADSHLYVSQWSDDTVVIAYEHHVKKTDFLMHLELTATEASILAKGLAEVILDQARQREVSIRAARKQKR